MRELSLNVLDIVQNSISAKSTIVNIEVNFYDKNKMRISITDDGCGMNQEQVMKVIDPFYTTRKTRKVGLGIPLFKMAAELTGGNLVIRSLPEKGTHISAEFVTDSIDMTPLGDMNSTILLLVRCNPDVDFVYSLTKDNDKREFNTKEIREILGEVPLDHPDVLEWIDGYLKEQFA